MSGIDYAILMLVALVGGFVGGWLGRWFIEWRRRKRERLDFAAMRVYTGGLVKRDVQ